MELIEEYLKNLKSCPDAVIDQLRASIIDIASQYIGSTNDFRTRDEMRQLINLRVYEAEQRMRIASINSSDLQDVEVTPVYYRLRL